MGTQEIATVAAWAGAGVLGERAVFRGLARQARSARDDGGVLLVAGFLRDVVEGRGIDEMELLCIGLSHKTAPVEVRERLTMSSEQQSALLAQLAAHAGEALLVSTCNRIEAYALGGGTQTIREAVHRTFSETAGHEMLSCLYEQHGPGRACAPVSGDGEPGFDGGRRATISSGK